MFYNLVCAQFDMTEVNIYNNNIMNVFLQLNVYTVIIGRIIALEHNIRIFRVSHTLPYISPHTPAE